MTSESSPAERRRVPHALYGVLPLSEALSAARWRAQADLENERCLAAGRTAILCGGSGLYLRTLMQGIATIPDTPTGLREQANAEWMSLGVESFRARLAEKDPAIVARLKPADRQRHVRAWEVWLATGRPLTAWQESGGAARRFFLVVITGRRGRPRTRSRTGGSIVLSAANIHVIARASVRVAGQEDGVALGDIERPADARVARQPLAAVGRPLEGGDRGALR